MSVLRFPNGLVGIFILATAILLSGGLGRAEEPLDFSIPPPPRSEALGEQAFNFLGRNTQIAAYWSGHDPKAVILHYELFFKSKGFVASLPFSEPFDKASEKTLTSQGQRLSPDLKNKSFTPLEKIARNYLRFKKDDLVVDIFLSPKEKGTEVAVMKYFQPPGSPDIEKTPDFFQDPTISGMLETKKDTPGEDLEMIPRPPESTRCLSERDARWGETRLVYTTSLSVAEVRAFYQNQLPQQGWEMETTEIAPSDDEQYAFSAGSNTELRRILQEDPAELFKDSCLLDFQGSLGRARIIIFPNFMDRRRSTIVDITYNRHNRPR